MKHWLFATVVGIAASCSGARPAPAPDHTGWSVRYTVRSGNGEALPDDVRPDVVLLVRDGHAALQNGPHEARLDGAHRHASVCESGACRATDYLEAVASTDAFAGVVADARGAQEVHPVVETLDDRLLIADVPTRGLRVAEQLARGGQTLRTTVEVRWIDDPGDVSVEVAKDVFLSPLERAGWGLLAAEIRRAAGLPVAWLLRVSVIAPNGSTVREQAISLRAALLGNPPGVAIDVR